MPAAKRSPIDYGGDPTSLTLFGQDPSEQSSESHRLDLPDAEMYFYPALFSKSEADSLFDALLAKTEWTQEKIKYYGRLFDLPRLTAWYGDPDKVYKYSGIRTETKPWNADLLTIKRRIEEVSRFEFNSVLLNLYRDERDSVAWHADDEPEVAPTIGSVSFGASRTFMFRGKQDKSRKGKVELTHGSFLLMTGPTQRFWQHQIAKSTRGMGKRINLTFRKITNAHVPGAIRRSSGGNL